MTPQNIYHQSDLLENTKKILTFDIEIAKELPDDFDDFKANRPLGVSCAAALTDEGELIIWHGGKREGKYTEQMTETEVSEMVDHLWNMIQKGYQIYTWNGLGLAGSLLG